jgi:two-component system response regulator AtoC
MLEQVNGQDWNKDARDSQDAVSMELIGRILIVDDDPHFLRVLARILSGENFLVTSAGGACDALELVKSAQFDLIISDLRMPECDGLGFLEALRQGGNNAPVIILTAYGEVDTYLAAMNAGATEYLNKPMHSDELLRVVRSCLRSRAHRRKTASSDPV